jgi:hypothetical protein
MTDREMLELAAKAAGIKVPTKEDYPWAYIDERGIHRDISSGGDGSRMSHWNPLVSDGDAFRLAVKLKLDIEFDAESAYPYHVLVEQYDLGLGFREDLLNDPYAATRLAIVRAASEIGRNMND